MRGQALQRYYAVVALQQRADNWTYLGHDGCFVLILREMLPSILCCHLQAAARAGIGEQHTPVPGETEQQQMQQNAVSVGAVSAALLIPGCLNELLTLLFGQ